MIVKDENGKYCIKAGHCVHCKYHMQNQICGYCGIDHELWEPKETKIKYTLKDEIDEYILNDIKTTKLILNRIYASGAPAMKPFAIDKVIFNDPATIVLWKDGTKTVVKVQEGDYFDPEKGLAMAIAKKAYGNKGKYCDEIKKWTEVYDDEPIYPCIDISRPINIEAFNKSIHEFLSNLAMARKENN